MSEIALLTLALVITACGQSSVKSNTTTMPLGGAPPGWAGAGSLGPNGGPLSNNTLPADLVLATGENAPGPVAIDSTYVFWGTSIQDDCCAEVRVVAKAGGTPTTVFSAPRQLDLPNGVNHQAVVVRLSVDADWIFADVLEQEVIPTTDGPDRHSVGSLWRISRADGTAEAVALPQGYSDVRHAEKSINLLKAPPLDSKSRELELAIVSKATGASTVSTFRPPDPLFGYVDDWIVDSDTLYISYSNYFGAANAHCVARAPVGGGDLEDLWCPDSPARQLAVGADNLFVYSDGSQAGFWMVNKDTGAARAIAAAAANGAVWAVDEENGMLFGMETTLEPMVSELFQITLATGARAKIDLAQGYRHTGMQLDADRIFFAKGNDVFSLGRVTQ